MRSNDFDPLAYIENAFLDKQKQEPKPDTEGLDAEIPTITEYLNGNGKAEVADSLQTNGQDKKKRFKKTMMSAPRPRRAKKEEPEEKPIDPELQACWETLPKSIEFLCSFYDDSVTANYYRGEFKESRKDLIQRLLDPELSLEETSRLLGVCPATVRRYTNRGWLSHHRTTGGQRRFRLSSVVKFVEKHGRFPEA